MSLGAASKFQPWFSVKKNRIAAEAQVLNGAAIYFDQAVATPSGQGLR